MCKRTSPNSFFGQDRLIGSKIGSREYWFVASAYGAKVFCSISSLSLSFGFTKPISMLLQGSDMEICCTYKIIANVQAAFEDIRNNSDNEFHNLYSKTNSMTERVGKAPPTKTRTFGRQNLRNNVVSDTPEDYLRGVIFLPFIDCVKNSSAIDLKKKVNSSFKAVKIIPNNLEQCKAEDEALVLEYYNEDLPSPSTFQQELKLWK